MNKRAITIWLTGLSGSGKTTISKLLQKQYNSEGYFSIFLDGDIVRSGLNHNLGYSHDDRKENIRRVAEIAKIINDNGINVICSFISPTNEIRQLARKIIGEKHFYLIFIDTAFEICKARDAKGFYRKALDGKLKNFTGIDSIYQRPQDAHLVINTERKSPESIAEYIYEIVNSGNINLASCHSSKFE